ncbi:hypothetical protein [Nocardia wallacei]|uniref:hypothetical protein n=1 Tax=Nocardia wallacei TaxID=480035 RepID=UPI0024569494|nr:hypothetical protein [Nocardia wallacei]
MTGPSTTYETRTTSTDLCGRIAEHDDSDAPMLRRNPLEYWAQSDALAAAEPPSVIMHSRFRLEEVTVERRFCDSVVP